MPSGRQQYSSSDQGSAIEAGSGYRAVVVSTRSSSEFRDLVSYRRDLELAKVFADCFLAMGVEKVDNTREPSLALWIAALTSYGRAFKSGVRSVKPSIEMLDANDLKWHSYFVDLRDKHVAHAVNGYEQTIILAFLSDSAFEERKVDRVGYVHVDLFPSEEEVRTLSALSDVLLKDLAKRIRKLRGVVSREVIAMGTDAVYRCPPAVVPTHDPELVSRRRK